MEVSIILPWPPSVNSLWRSSSKGWYMTKKAKEYKELVRYAVYKAKSPKFGDGEQIAVGVVAYPPDNRKRDLDNIFKILGDSLQDAGVYQNDCQIKKIYMEMKPKADVGAVHVKIWSLPSL